MEASVHSIVQLRTRMAAAARARDTALVGALAGLTVCLWVLSVLVIGARAGRIAPVAATAALPGGPTPTTPPTLSVPDQPVRLPGEVPAPAVPPDQQPPPDGDGLAANGIPRTALRAYQNAETLLSGHLPSCHLDWPLIAALGRVESNHGQLAGASLSPSGLSTPPIRGPRLDGGAFALIRDTDRGRLDSDTEFDRAVGPLQFIPQTWRAVGTDATGDATADPDNIFDAALSAGIYLCSGNTDLADPAALRAAIFRYNHSNTYVDLVLSLATRYRTGATITPDNAPAAAAPIRPAPTPPPPARPATPAAPAGSSPTGDPTPTGHPPPPGASSSTTPTTAAASTTRTTTPAAGSTTVPGTTTPPRSTCVIVLVLRLCR